jgi:hypothetical protein
VKAIPEFLYHMIVAKFRPDCNACAVATEIYDRKAGSRHVAKFVIRNNLGTLPLEFIREWYRMFEADNKLIASRLLRKQLANIPFLGPTQVPAEDYNSPAKRYPPVHVRIDLLRRSVNFGSRPQMVNDFSDGESDA